MSDRQKERSFEETAESLLKVVRQLAAELQPGRKELSSVTLDSSLDRDLGLDSLARVELLIRIERTFGNAARSAAGRAERRQSEAVPDNPGSGKTGRPGEGGCRGS